MPTDEQIAAELTDDEKLRVLWTERQQKLWLKALLGSTGKWIGGAVAFALAALGLWTTLSAFLVSKPP